MGPAFVNPSPVHLWAHSSGMGALSSCGLAEVLEGLWSVWWGEHYRGRRLGYCPPFTRYRQGPWANHLAHLESKVLDQMIFRAFL